VGDIAVWNFEEFVIFRQIQGRFRECIAVMLGAAGSSAAGLRISEGP